jgi:hypothetical protein
VNYSGAAAAFSRGWRVPEAALPWSTGHCPVNYSGVPLEIPEGGKFGVGVLWCTGHCPVCTGQSGAPRPEVPSVAPLLLC